MAGKVVERHGYEIVDGEIIYNETNSTYDVAEGLCGKRLDRRKNYAIIEGKVAESVSWTQECSGCDGCGCEECGHHGKCRRGIWVALTG